MSVGEEIQSEVFPVTGVKLAAVESSIRYQNRLDLVLVEVAEGSNVAGVFTRNAFCAAPVTIARNNLASLNSRYFLVNTGNANAGTGEAGEVDALRCCQAVADIARVDLKEVLPFSTGVIGEPLPVDKILAGIPNAFTALSASDWRNAAVGIMTTDTRPKLASRQVSIAGELVNVSGFAKGAGMIKPNMATMLAYVFTDATIPQTQLQAVLDEMVNTSFNRITVDGDTSTNDCCMLVATGHTEASMNGELETAIREVFTELAVGLIKDAEGASKFLTVNVQGGASTDECLAVAYVVAESPLVKTALFAADPNWGRILAAVGRAGIMDLDISAVSILLGDLLIAENGGVAETYEEELGQAEMDKDEVSVTIQLGRGDCAETVWTSDLSHEYIRINAEYRT